MAVSDIRKTDFVWKKIKGRRFTTTDKSFYEEFPGFLVNPHASEVWADEIPIPAPGTTSDPVRYFHDLVLTEDISVSDSQSWLACETPGDLTTQLRGWIPPRFHQSYTVRIFDDSGNEITTTHDSTWFFDYENGVLVFENPPTNYGITLPIHLRGYIYTGENFAGSATKSSNIYVFNYNENDYATGNGNSHKLWLKQDVLKDSNLFRVYIDGTEHNFRFFDQRLYKISNSIDPVNYYTQHIDIDDYPIGSESGRSITINYTEEIKDQNTYNLILSRDDDETLNNKSLPLTFSVWDGNVGKFYYYYLHNTSPNEGAFTIDVTYRCAELSGQPNEYKFFTRVYAKECYVKEFPRNYDFLTNNNMLLEMWQVNSRRDKYSNIYNTNPDNMYISLKTLFRYNLINNFNKYKPGLYIFRFLHLTDNTFSRWFQTKLKITRFKVFHTDPTLSVKYYTGVIPRTFIS